MEYIRFATPLIPRILNTEKTTTARYDFSRPIAPGDSVLLVDEYDSVFAEAVITSVRELTIGEFVSDTPDGHQTYASVEDCISVFEQYYPEAELDAGSVLTVIGFGEVVPVEVYRAGM